MIALLLMIAAPQAAPAADPQANVRVAALVWKSCVEVIAAKYAKTRDSAGDIATAALYECRSAGAGFESAGAAYLSSTGIGGMKAQDMAKAQRQHAEADMRGAAMDAVLKARSGR
jgi:hypothetical protein